MLPIIDQPVLFSTLKITCGSGVGTCFLVRKDHRRFLITASHVCPSVIAGDRVAIWRHGGWAYVPVTGIQRCVAGTDLAVIRVPDGEGAGLPWEMLKSDVCVGESVSYCGFPLGLQMDDMPDTEGFPISIVKSGIVSGFFHKNGQSVILIDTINNSGFSGGPVVRYCQESKTRYVFAVVFEYIFDSKSHVYRRRADGNFELVGDLFVQPNSGFMRAVSIRHAQDAISLLM